VSQTYVLTASINLKEITKDTLKGVRCKMSVANKEMWALTFAETYQETVATAILKKARDLVKIKGEFKSRRLDRIRRQLDQLSFCRTGIKIKDTLAECSEKMKKEYLFTLIGHHHFRINVTPMLTTLIEETLHLTLMQKRSEQ